MKQETTSKGYSAKAKSPSVKPNILMFGYVIYFILLAPYFIAPFVWNIIDREIGPVLTSLIAQVIFIVPGIIYLLHVKFCEKRSVTEMLSIRSLSWKNALYISIITLAFAQTYSLLGLAIPFLLGDVQMPSSSLAVWQYFLMGAIIATIFEEFVFRGVLWGEYRNHNVSFWKIALATGLFFGLIHGGIVSVADTTFSGIFLYAPLIYITRSIWAPVIHHAIVNGRWGLHPVNFVSSQAEYEAFMPTYLIIMGIIVAILIPLAVICAKKFWKHNQHNHIAKKDLPKESIAFRLTYWALIVAMLVAIVLFGV
ncbi:MAG: CPBP family intramembrane metalloprotease [Oscillospiraceae bacterium]|nr:CPBP family intramembrane metalloprotease [Oscillospiraceae bacterium]